MIQTSVSDGKSEDGKNSIFFILHGAHSLNLWEGWSLIWRRYGSHKCIKRKKNTFFSMRLIWKVYPLRTTKSPLTICILFIFISLYYYQHMCKLMFKTMSILNKYFFYSCCTMIGFNRNLGSIDNSVNGIVWTLVLIRGVRFHANEEGAERIRAVDVIRGICDVSNFMLH